MSCALSSCSGREVENVQHRILGCHRFGDVAEMRPEQTPERGHRQQRVRVFLNNGGHKNEIQIHTIKKGCLLYAWGIPTDTTVGGLCSKLFDGVAVYRSLSMKKNTQNVTRV